MNRNFSKIYFLFILIFILTSCKTKDLTMTRPFREATGYAMSDYFMEPPSFKYLIGKASAFYKSGNEDYSFYLNFRWVYDSAFWLSISPGLGIEAIRILLTKDSLFYFDRTKQEYLTESRQNLEEQWKLLLDFKFLQTVLSGKLFKPIDTLSYICKLTEESIYLTNNEYNKANRILPYFNFIDTFNIFLDEKTHTIKKMKFQVNSKKPIVVEINYKDYVLMDERYFPKEYSIAILNDKHSSLDFKIEKLQKVEQVLLPFHIPSTYKSLYAK